MLAILAAWSPIPAYVGGSDDALHAYGASDGSPLWSAPAGVSVVSRPIMDGRHQCTSAHATTPSMPWTPLLGKVGWSVQTGVNPSANLQTGAAPTLANGVLYVASSGGIVYTIDPARHAILWQSQASSGMQPPPAVVDGTVYVVTTDGMIQALRASDGKVSWSVPISGRMYAGPVTDAQT